jgi:hypothetical protein
MRQRQLPLLWRETPIANRSEITAFDAGKVWIVGIDER